MKRIFIFLAATVMIAAQSGAKDAPADYYAKAQGKSGKALLEALYSIVGNHGKISYDGLWEAYESTDVTTDGKYYWDMYATTKFPLGQKQCGSYKNIGDCVNREHSFPKSWWGGGKANQYSDIFHLYPTDGFVNNQRSAYPFGECANGTRLKDNGTNHALGKLGTCTFEGYTGKVFEPDDLYKGDFARTYFYMAAAYNNLIDDWSCDMLAGNNYPVYTTWAVNLLLKWHRLDPVSEKETNRNNAAYGTKQGNRNPFIDHPELAEHIWGDKKNVAWYPGGDPEPVLISPATGTIVDFGNVAVNQTVSQTIEVKGNYLTENLLPVVTGSAFAVSMRSISASSANSGTTLTITYTAPATAEASTGKLTLSSGEVNVSITLKAQAVDGIPALEATNITTSSFRARWTSLGNNEKYSLSVFEDDGTTLVDGYPVEVNAADGSYLVTGLKANTTYYYQVFSKELVSNVIMVTTLDNAKIISIQSDNDFEVTAAKGQASDILTAEVYTEYITEPVSLTVTGNFEISLNKKEWSKELSINPEGEIFYVRIADTGTVGQFEGELDASTATLDGYNVDITGNVYDPEAKVETVVEGFESVATGGYWTKQVQADVFLWDFDNAGVWADAHKVGANSCRFGKNATSSITMAEDYTKGASAFGFYAAPFGSDANAELTVSYSTDQGTTWNELQKFTVTNVSSAPAYRAEAVAGMNYYEVSQKFNIQGNIRFRIAQTSGSRVNVDGISITGYAKPTAINAIKGDNNAKTWDAVPAGNGTITIESDHKAKFYVYSFDAREVATVKTSSKANVTGLPAGIYIVTDGKTSRKVIVK